MPIILAGGGPPSIFDSLPTGADPAQAIGAIPPPAQNPAGSDPTPNLGGPSSPGYSTILRPPPRPAAATTAKDDLV